MNRRKITVALDRNQITQYMIKGSRGVVVAGLITTFLNSLSSRQSFKKLLEAMMLGGAVVVGVEIVEKTILKNNR